MNARSGVPEKAPAGRSGEGPAGSPPLLERLFLRLQAVAAWRSDIDGRILVAGALAVYFVAVGISRSLVGIDLWRALGVPSGPSLFFDTRNITAALECHRLGLDPLVENPCDPWDRPMVYPRMWLALRWLGLDQSHTTFVAVVFIGLFLTSIFMLMGRISLGQGSLVALAVCSPAVMFAIERANVDIVVFSLMVLAVLVWSKPRGAVLSPLIVLVGALAKIYPVFALGAFLFSRRRVAIYTALLCAGSFALYAAVTSEDIRAVIGAAPQGQHYSFGARILIAAIYHQFVADRWTGTVAKQLVAILPFLLAAPVLWLWGRARRPSEELAASDRSLLAFHAGALLFLGTFAIANNFDYRLVFLLLTLPQLFRWVASGFDDPRGILAGATLGVILVLLWIGALSGPLRLADELVTWAAAGFMAVLTVASIPTVRVEGLLARYRKSASEGR